MGIIIRQSIKGTVVNYVGAFIGFLTQIFVWTKYFQLEEVGLARFFYEAAFLIAGFALLGVSGSAFRFFPYFQSEKNKHNGFFFYLVLLPTIGCLIFIPLYIFLKDPISAYFSTNSALFVDYFYWIIFAIIFIVFWIAFETYSNVLMRIVIPKFIREIAVRVLLLAVYLLFAFKFLNIDGLVGGIIATYGIAMLLSFIYVSRIGPISLKHNYSYIEKPLKIKIRNYTFFLLLTALCANILPVLGFFMVSGQLGLDYAGIFSVALYMGAAVDIPSRSISSISSPIAAQALKEGDMNAANRLYQKVSLHQLVAGSCIFLLIWINIDNIYAIIPNGNLYAAGKWVVLFIAFSRILNVIFNFGAILLSYSKYYYWSLFFTVFILMAGIITNYLLIPIMGITGAAIGTLLTAFLLSIVQQWIVMAKIKGNPFSAGMLKFIILIAVLFGINYVLPQWTSNPYVDLLYRTMIIGLITVFSIYKLKISDEITAIMDKFLKRI